MYNKYFKHEKGITGLETAIILIAFIVVAAVFAYTVVSAGLFSTQKGAEAVYQGLKEAQTVVLKGPVIATGNTSGVDGNVRQITFTVANIVGSEAIDFNPPTAGNVTGLAGVDSLNKVVINFITPEQNVENLYWTVTKVGNDNGDSMLDPGEKFQVTVGGDSDTSGAGNLINALDPDLGINTTFNLVVMTPAGAVLTIERTTPSYIDIIMNLH